MIDMKSLVILMTLMKYQQLSLYELTVKTNFSEKEVLTNLKELDDFLVSHQFPEILKRSGCFSLNPRLVADSDLIFSQLKDEQIYLNQEERIYLIYLYTFCRQEFISNTHYQDLVKVSKNTSLSDVRLLRERLSDNGVTLNYSRAEGYFLRGREDDKHRVALHFIRKLLRLRIGYWALHYVLDEWQVSISYEQLSQKIAVQYKMWHLTPLKNRLEECLYLMIFLLCRYQRAVDRPEFADLSVSQQLRELTSFIVETISQNLQVNLRLNTSEQAYLTLILAGCFEGEGDLDSEFFDQLTLDIVLQMEQVSLLSFENRNELLQGLKKHIIPAYYRLKYGLATDSSYTQRIKDSYPDLFHLVKRALEPLRNVLGIKIPESEVAYFVVHFGGYLQKTELSLPYRAVIVCPNGVSSSLIIKENLKALFPKIAFSGISRVDDFQKISEKDYDLVFSTVRVETTKPFYMVPMVMTNRQIDQLLSMVEKDFPDICEEDFEIEHLMALIKEHATIFQERELRLALRKQLLHTERYRKEYRPLLHELITEETYQFTDLELNWQEAIRLAAQPLLASGQIEETYPQAMIDKVRDFGPFIDLGQGIAIPHARPEDGVNAVGMSMLSLEHPIHLLDDPSHEIKLLLCIAAVDNETHLKALSHLTTILRDKGNVERLVSSKTYDDIKTIIKQEA
ncbi:Predicted galactitol operon regulator (Transcriptional antiterminator), BglG family / PTS system,mannitol/fructose-specific IIA component [Streptococcus acidominimus]|uniref:Predicted galactitol operon regulator (Transcriptional antiterminator), BglG family / PTS system,mannitol/fructose-specific IIA component n=1 Tax=Streptococcus acidominimus TaxID=1326 RepID=A0A239WEF9_STRAI|nr:BglG family transcription antiterminator [Streptococcus acidominimus]SNV32308.1 Predicted galactitol operon regulator (Transcriptional antiterminator), BglG family / PTS system,mannitol/fructose-specific IIA component [Streptococcus acidominimus]